MPGWAISADPAKFDEALQFLLARVVITAETAAALDDDSRQRAFWIGGGLQLRQIQNVFDEIGKALESGEPFDEWRDRVRKTLRNDAHAETVFRNATQRALNAGRYRQMREPSVAKFRPYWMFDAVLDSRTTEEICRPRDKVTLPAEHDWWQGNVPPLHHRCRSGIRNLRKSEAEKRGITNVPPPVAAPGWGAAPDKAPIWKPDPATHDRKLLEELEAKKVKADNKPPPKPPKRKPEHDPKHWEAEYSHLGEAAANAAWGRTMLERGLDRSGVEVHAELKRLLDAGHPSLRRAAFELSGIAQVGNRPLRGTTAGHRARSLIALAEHTRTIKPAADFAAGEAGTALSSAVLREAELFYRLTLDANVGRPRGYHIDFDSTLDGGRSYHSTSAPRSDGTHGPRIALNPSAPSSIVAHEIAHAVEASDARARARYRAFLLARSKGVPRKRMVDLEPDKNYKPHEMTWEDELPDPYFGIDYGPHNSEVTSMGYQRLMERPHYFTRGSHRAEDEELLFFLLGQLAGR